MSLRLIPLFISVFLGAFQPMLAQDDVADVPSADLRLHGDEQKRYFLIGPAKDAKAPTDGYGLIVVMPGGPGSADFHPFVKRIYKNAIPEGYLVAQPVAVKFTEKQAIVWPTSKSPVENMKFTTEEFVAGVIANLQLRLRRILVVDDQADVAESMGRLLSVYGHEVRTVFDSCIALRVFSQFRRYFVLLDIGMPGMDGH